MATDEKRPECGGRCCVEGDGNPVFSPRSDCPLHGRPLVACAKCGRKEQGAARAMAYPDQPIPRAWTWLEAGTVPVCERCIGGRPRPSDPWRVLVNDDGEPYAVENSTYRRGVGTDLSVEPDRSRTKDPLPEEHHAGCEHGACYFACPVLKWVRGARTNDTRNVALADAIVRNNADTADLIAFVSNLAEHPDIGDSLTAAEREKDIQRRAREVLAGQRRESPKLPSEGSDQDQLWAKAWLHERGYGFDDVESLSGLLAYARARGRDDERDDVAVAAMRSSPADTEGK